MEPGRRRQRHRRPGDHVAVADVLPVVPRPAGLLYLMPTLFFVIRRNELVDPEDKVLTPRHLKSLANRLFSMKFRLDADEDKSRPIPLRLFIGKSYRRQPTEDIQACRPGAADARLPGGAGNGLRGHRAARHRHPHGAEQGRDVGPLPRRRHPRTVGPVQPADGRRGPEHLQGAGRARHYRKAQAAGRQFLRRGHDGSEARRSRRSGDV